MSTAPDNWFPKHRINVDEYYRMVEVGLLAPDERVELIEGEVIDMSPIGSKHAAIVDLLNELLGSVLNKRAIVAVQRPIRLNQRSEPQPDIALLKSRKDRYAAAHPAPADVLLLIEVSDTTLRYDRDIKVPLYARHGIPEVWLIDVSAKQLHCMRDPSGEGYASTTLLQSGSIEPAALPGAAIDLSEVFGV